MMNPGYLKKEVKGVHKPESHLYNAKLCLNQIDVNYLVCKLGIIPKFSQVYLPLFTN